MVRARTRRLSGSEATAADDASAGVEQESAEEPEATMCETWADGPRHWLTLDEEGLIVP